MTKGDTRKILAVYPGALGDVILFGRLLANLPGEVTLITGGEKGRLLVTLGAVARAIDFDLLPIEELFSDSPAKGGRLSEILGGYDRLISCFGTGDSRVQTRLTEICGVDDAIFLPIRPPADFDGHLLELWGDLLGLSENLESYDRQCWNLPTQSREIELAFKLCEKLDKPLIVMHPGAGSLEKCWPVNMYIELSQRIQGEGFTPVFLWGPVEADRMPGAKDRLLEAGEVLEEISLIQLASVLSNAAVFVGNDSGPGHLAAGLGCVTVSLFGPTNAAHFRPIGRNTWRITGDNLNDIKVNSVHELLSIIIGSE